MDQISEAASLPSRDDASTVGSRPPVVDGKAFFRSGFSVNSVVASGFKWFFVSVHFFWPCLLLKSSVDVFCRLEKYYAAVYKNRILDSHGVSI